MSIAVVVINIAVPRFLCSRWLLQAYQLPSLQSQWHYAPGIAV